MSQMYDIENQFEHIEDSVDMLCARIEEMELRIEATEGAIHANRSHIMNIMATLKVIGNKFAAVFSRRF